MSVVPGRSTIRAPDEATLASGPAASIRSPFTRTAHPSWIVSPSKTRAGLIIVIEGGLGVCATGATIAIKAAAIVQDVFRIGGL